jgi:hypothetical protein
VAQNSTCYSFDDHAVPVDSQQQAFYYFGDGHSGFLQDWNVTSGTPCIQTSGQISGVNAYDGNQYALMCICNSGVGNSEGVSLHHNFAPGQTYTVSMAIRNIPITGSSPVPIDVNFILLQNAISYNYNPSTGCSSTPAVPAGSLIVDSIINYAQNSWSVISFTISNLTTTYSQLWIRLNYTNGYDPNTTAFCFDSVCITDELLTSLNLIRNTESNGKAILYQNDLNPFTSATTIRYYLPESTEVAQLTIYDITGKLIKKLELKIWGNGEVWFEAAGLSSGAYFYSLIADNKRVDTKKMFLVK